MTVRLRLPRGCRVEGGEVVCSDEGFAELVESLVGEAGGHYSRLVRLVASMGFELAELSTRVAGVERELSELVGEFHGYTALAKLVVYDLPHEKPWLESASRLPRGSPLRSRLERVASILSSLRSRVYEMLYGYTCIRIGDSTLLCEPGDAERLERDIVGLYESRLGGLAREVEEWRSSAEAEGAKLVGSLRPLVIVKDVRLLPGDLAELLEREVARLEARLEELRSRLSEAKGRRYYSVARQVARVQELLSRLRGWLQRLRAASQPSP